MAINSLTSQGTNQPEKEEKSESNVVRHPKKDNIDNIVEVSTPISETLDPIQKTLYSIQETLTQLQNNYSTSESIKRKLSEIEEKLDSLVPSKRRKEG